MDRAEEEEVFESLAGRRIVHFSRGEGGFHIELDNDKTLVLVGSIGIVEHPQTLLQ